MTLVLYVLFLLQIKHLICDFIHQPPYMYKNKGNIRHPGGYVHAGVHALASLFMLTIVFPLNAVIWGIVVFEFIAHYAIDWSKMNINSHFGLTPINSENFWRLLGVDQFLHQLTYLAMVMALFITAGS